MGIDADDFSYSQYAYCYDLRCSRLLPLIKSIVNPHISCSAFFFLFHTKKSPIMSRNVLLRIHHHSPFATMTSGTPHRCISRIHYRSISSMTQDQNHMTPKPVSIPQFQSKQSSNHFSTSTNKMSDTNKNFLLSEVFNVKGKVMNYTSSSSYGKNWKTHINRLLS